MSWEDLHGQAVSETVFVKALSQLPLEPVLESLISLLQYCDLAGRSNYEKMDNQIYDLFPTKMGRRIDDRLSQGLPWAFFSQWQLLFAIKLLCAFGSRDVARVQVTDDQLIRVLLMTNGFYPSGESDPGTVEGLVMTFHKAILRGYSVIPREQPMNLIGRYSELFGRLAAPANRSDFKSYVDIQSVLVGEMGVQLDVFKAVLFALYGHSIVGSPWTDDGKISPQLGSLAPEQFFADTVVLNDQLNRALDLVSTSPDEIREEHRREYGDGIGNPVDLGMLLRKPVIVLPDGNLAGISGQLLIQRHTCGLYWDINDALPDEKNATPSRRQFQTFFGELHERYGQATLQRIRDQQLSRKKKIRLLSEDDYRTQSGRNPDSLLIETIGGKNTRCTLFEFKVGRPRYQVSIVGGDVPAFEEDLRIKVEEGLNQEIEFCQAWQSGERTIPDLLARDVTAWFFVIVVTDPFPSMGTFLEPLRKKLADSPDLGSAKRYGPFVLSLQEIEQLETIPKYRVSEWFLSWNAGRDRDWPFNTFYANRTNGQPIENSYVLRLAEDDMARARSTLFGRSST